MSGETKSKGIEVDITARPIEGLNIIAGYSYNDMRYTKTSGLNGSFIEGDRVGKNSSKYSQLKLFLYIANWNAKRCFSWSNRKLYWRTYLEVGTTNTIMILLNNLDGINHREIPLDGYTTIDVSAGYTWKKFSIFVNYQILQMN